MLEQEAQQGVFLGGEVDLRASFDDGAFGEIHLHIAEDHDADLAGRLGAAQENAHPRQQARRR